MTQHLTLFELNSLVSRAISTAMPRDYWVEAELLELRVSHGHCYMELVQKDIHSAGLVARASAKCWQSRWRTVSQRFISATGTLPTPGMKLLVRASVDFHTTYGFALIVTDIDPAYTLGAIALRRQEIIATLQAEGVYDLQRQLTLPLFCQRIAVISSDSAAGYGDFCQQLINNDYQLHFDITLFPAMMQGDQVTPSIIAQLDSINANMDKYDCVVIIRGGGATADMNSFDSLPLAENIANFPLPVITGIGHDRDECVLDLIAYHRAKTPTAVATFLVDHLLAIAARIEQAEATITNTIPLVLSAHNNHLHQLAMAISSQATLYAARSNNTLQLLTLRLNTAAQDIIKSRQHHLSLLAQRIDSLDPKQQLLRGYSLTLHNGHVVRSPKDVQPGQHITTILAQGTIESVVE